MERKYGEKYFLDQTVICQCNSQEHQFTFTFDPVTEDNQYQECYLEVHLNDPCRDSHRFLGQLFCGKFWKRIGVGIAYLFGHRSRYGAWDSVIVTRDDAAKLRDMFDRYVLFCEEKDRKTS